MLRPYECNYRKNRVTLFFARELGENAIGENAGKENGKWQEELISYMYGRSTEGMSRRMRLKCIEKRGGAISNSIQYTYMYGYVEEIL